MQLWCRCCDAVQTLPVWMLLQVCGCSDDVVMLTWSWCEAQACCRETSMKHATTGLWSSANLFCGAMNLFGSLRGESGFDQCQENVTCLTALCQLYGDAWFQWREINASANQDIMDNALLPALWEQFEQAPFLFQHDCASVRITKARSKKTWLDELGVEKLDCPSQSPDLNYIKHWGWTGTEITSQAFVSNITAWPQKCCE